MSSFSYTFVVAGLLVVAGVACGAVGCLVFPGLGRNHPLDGVMFAAIVASPMLICAGLVMMLRRSQLVVRRAERGACVRCGYPLETSSVVCPECGTRRFADDGPRTEPGADGGRGR